MQVEDSYHIDMELKVQRVIGIRILIKKNN